MEFKQELTKVEKQRNKKISQDSFLSTLSDIFSLYPDLTIYQHIEGIRSELSKVNKSVGGADTVKTGDERMVRAAEKYFAKLEQDPPQLWNEGDDYLTDDEIVNFYERNSQGNK